ncbi:ATP-binding protein [Noviherbaspirillum massiliense]|uniref:ATP-binding protein n=1 Tax=Noviherbaspirillum massiliense TaxID=1465823 RepID=UPI0003093E79|nr:ATP-binding protein [Noviherbaspirillum massiliense]
MQNQNQFANAGLYRFPEKARKLFKPFERRFVGRLDSEHEQAFVRLCVGIVLGCYFSYFAYQHPDSGQMLNTLTVSVMAVFILASAALIIHIALYPEISVSRRMIGAALDSGTTTYFAFTLPEFAAPLYSLYLWLIFGHGFRFGRRYLFFTLALSLVGFGAAVAYVPYWADKTFLGVGLWVGMLLISCYLSTLVNRLMKALEHAEAANLAKRRFVSSISHEMRTPLNAVIGMADLLQSTDLNKDQEEMVRSMDSASRLMLSLIEDVLDFSKIEAGKLVVENTPFNLHQLIHETAKLFKYQAAAKNLALQVDLHPDVPEPVIGDPTHLRQVLSNLLSNALKFTEKGRVVLRTRALGVDTKAARLRFEIEDTGIGIAPDAQAHIFESFTQADASTTRQYGGTGLGTTISKQLAELMGGRLGFYSEAGKGSTFWLELKLPLQPAVPAAAPAPVMHGPQKAQLPPPRQNQDISVQRQYRILVAEDNSLNRKVIEKMLARAGHVCTLATNGEEALDLLTQSSFDAVILDMNMPEMSGLEVIKAYRYMHGAKPRFPFVMLSADVTQELQTECLASGFDEFLPKPIQIAQLLTTIDRLVEQYQSISSPDEGSGGSPASAAETGMAKEDSSLLNYEILHELDEITSDNAFLNGLIDEFATSTQALTDKLERALHMQQMSDCRNILHAIKGSALGIGAVSLQATCEEFERTSQQKLQSDPQFVVAAVRNSYRLTQQALENYRRRRQRPRAAMNATN